MSFIEREMTDKTGGCFAALDADSDGKEGKYYVWQMDEIQTFLKEDAAIFIEAYGISSTGNWEGSNILHLPRPLADTAKKLGLSTRELAQKLKSSKARLLKYREKRVKPGLDDKIVLNWNALQCTAYLKAFSSIG